ncbi:MAG: pilus assembly protein TadG-related protein, partial [Desulfurivibrionaceae bacterium]|nr:pilus assembly protein TadG-related protein [Desulfurivibrionaceae bacterium]
MKTITSGSERGAVVPLVAILMGVFILCIALVVDLGHLHNVKVQLQRAVDAAALAGAQQLDGSDGQDNRAEAVARATADANRIDSESGWVDNPDDVVFSSVMGRWDTEITGASPVERFDSGVAADTGNAIKVTATKRVDNIFFFLTENSTVSADAIAVSTFEEQTIPIALVSCVPTGGDSIQIKSPGLSVCDITTYRFHSDSEDTAAWT